ncbi:GTP-binding protein [Paenirhodobacter sp.]|uniref:GTP-binding protein n=1 Tax=Paenirhodobacter sp. TaxID=1965326 RepID=UPI003B4FFA0E
MSKAQGVIRAKGHFRITSRPKRAVACSLAGGMSPVTPPWASVPRWPILKDDRRQELAVIGAGMDNPAPVAARTFNPRAWAKLPDPFPQWGPKRVA